MGRLRLALAFVVCVLTACIVGKDRPSDGGAEADLLPSDVHQPTHDSVGDQRRDGPSPDQLDTIAPDTVTDTTATTDVGPCGNLLLDEGEPCDDQLFSVSGCDALGFQSGDLLCTANCEFDLARCRQGCGNSLLEPPELCDGTAVGGKACATFGFNSGSLACTSSCSAFDITDCSFGCPVVGRGGSGCNSCEVGFDPSDCTGCVHPYRSPLGGGCELSTQCGPRHLLAHEMAGDAHAGSEFVVEGTAAQPVVRDTLTGLSWQRCPVGMSWSAFGSECQGQWSTYSFAGLGAACQGSWGGFDDWRMPRPHEIESLLSYGPGAAPIDDTLFPDFSSPLSLVLWTSMLVGTDVAFALDAMTGSGVAEQSSSLRAVLCVRSPDLPAPKRRFRVYSARGDEIVDLWTRRIWHRCADGQSWDDGAGLCTGTPRARDHFDSRRACENVGSRLPTARELRSLREFCQAADSVGMPDAVAFPGLRRGRYWTSTPGEEDHYWSVGLGQTGSGEAAEANMNLTLCVDDS